MAGMAGGGGKSHAKGRNDSGGPKGAMSSSVGVNKPSGGKSGGPSTMHGGTANSGAVKSAFRTGPGKQAKASKQSRPGVS